MNAAPATTQTTSFTNFVTRNGTQLLVSVFDWPTEPSGSGSHLDECHCLQVQSVLRRLWHWALQADGKPFHFAGFNNYYLPTYSAWQQGRADDVDVVFR